MPLSHHLPPSPLYIIGGRHALVHFLQKVGRGAKEPQGGVVGGQSTHIAFHRVAHTTPPHNTPKHRNFTRATHTTATRETHKSNPSQDTHLQTSTHIALLPHPPYYTYHHHTRTTIIHTYHHPPPFITSSWVAQQDQVPCCSASQSCKHNVQRHTAALMQGFGAM